MARSSRLLACAALAAGLCALLLHGGTVAKVPAPGPRFTVQERIAVVVALLVLHTLQVASALLPGLVVSFGAYNLYSARERLSGKMRAVVALLVLAAAVTLFYSRSGAPSAEQKLARAGNEGGVVAQPRSGEEVLMSDGNFVRMADPSNLDGSPLTEEWRQKLAQALVTAIAKGEEQVAIMFTRQGCPWCDRQLPVLQKAIRRRATVSAGAGAAAAGAAFVGGEGAGVMSGSSFLKAPLRVFILDAEEFPQLMQQFGVEAFPTNLVFGRPRVTPIMGRGFLELETLEEVCREAALSEPEPEEGAPQRKSGGKKGRRGLFR